MIVNKVYLVGTFEQYEAGFTPYFAFLDKEKAESFLDECHQVLKTKPEYQYHENEIDEDVYFKEMSSWRNNILGRFGNMLWFGDEIRMQEIDVRG